MSSSYDSVLIYTSLKCVALAFCTHWQFEEGEGFAPPVRTWSNLPQLKMPLRQETRRCGWGPWLSTPRRVNRLSTDPRTFSKKHIYSLPYNLPEDKTSEYSPPAQCSTHSHEKNIL